MSLLRQVQKLAPEKRLAQIIAHQGIVEAERELARHEPKTVLQLLIRLYTKETQAIKHIKYFVIIGLCLYWGAITLYYAVNRHFPSLWPLLTIPSWNFLGWQTNKKRAARERVEQLATLLLDRIKQAERSDLGALLELAPLAWESAPLLIPMRDRLATLLPRTPTDELSQLTQAQRTALQFVTRKAIDDAPYNDFFEPLAIAGLLALGSLKDKNLGGQASDARVAHTSSHVRAAAEEYLGAL